MLRSGRALLKKSSVAIGIDVTPLQNAICVQQVRGLRPRKPAYSGMAKSKLFRIPKRTEHPPDEAAEIRRISNQYRLYMRSISHFFKGENESHAAGSKEADKEHEEEEAEWEQSLVEIRKWNSEVAITRETRLLSERKSKEEGIRQRIIDEERQQELRLQEIEEIVRLEKERSKTFITPENIDKAITEALENKIDCNFALDVRGNKFVGRYVNASGSEDLPDEIESEEDSLPPLFQSSPVSSQFSSPK